MESKTTSRKDPIQNQGLKVKQDMVTKVKVVDKEGEIETRLVSEGKSALFIGPQQESVGLTSYLERNQES